MRELYTDINGVDGFVSVVVDQDWSQPTSNATIQCSSTSLSLGDAITIDIGYKDDHSVVFRGYVVEIDKSRAENEEYTIRCRDNLWRTMAYFIASEDPQAPLRYSNIPAERLVEEMLKLSGVTSYFLDSPGFTFAPEEPLEVNLTSAWDMINRVCWLIAWHCYDDNGTVRFLDRKPYNVPGDVSVHTFTTGPSGDIISIQPLATSSNKIRNRVVVYGKGDIHAEAKASSPFLPSGFYQTEVISAPDLIDTQSMANDIANYNLDLLNRLEKTITLTAEGNPHIQARTAVNVIESHTGASGQWFVYSCRHELSRTYTINLTLSQRQTS